jgi:hypothetical protein
MMTNPTSAERSLYSDLTRLFMSMRDAPQAALEAEIEERFRRFVRAQPEPRAGALQITMTWTLPDGPDDWAVYGTEYRTLPQDRGDEPRLAACAAGSADILEFPGHQRSEKAAVGEHSALIIKFPI